MHHIPVEDAFLAAAAILEPPSLRTLDAIHLAAALTLGDELQAIVTYDERMAEAARSLGFPVVQPGRDPTIEAWQGVVR
jgi:predicted nucleic acid-binding protein